MNLDPSSDPLLQQLISGAVAGAVTAALAFFFGRKKGYARGVHDASMRPPPPDNRAKYSVVDLVSEALESGSYEPHQIDHLVGTLKALGHDSEASKLAAFMARYRANKNDSQAR